MRWRWWRTASEMADEFARERDRLSDEEFVAACELPDDPETTRIVCAVRRSVANYGMVDPAFVRPFDRFPDELRQLSGWDSIDFLAWIFELERELGEPVQEKRFHELRVPFTVRDLAAIACGHPPTPRAAEPSPRAAEPSQPPAPAGSRTQFSLKKMLLFFVAVALASGLFGAWGIAVTLLLLLSTFWMKTWVEYVFFVLLVAILLLHWSYMTSYRGGHIRCPVHLQTISLAVRMYRCDYGQFPPQYVADAQGRPMHGWRVLILPYFIDRRAEDLYEEYRFDEPWNGPHNQGLAAEIAAFYRCPTTDAAEAARPLTTHYVVVSGSGMVFPGRTTTSLEDIADGADRTLAIVEIAGSDIQCLEPRDITLDEALSDASPYEVPSSHHRAERTYFFGSTYPLAGFIVMADGSIRMLVDPPSRENLAALLRIDDVGPADVDAAFHSNRGTSFLGLDLMRCALFVLFLVSFVLLMR